MRLPRGANVEKLPGFGEGAWWVQDIAAALPARLLGPGRGAPRARPVRGAGGKTLQLAAQGWQVTALDISKRRLDLLKANLRRTGLKAGAVRADALKWEPEAHIRCDPARCALHGDRDRAASSRCIAPHRPGGHRADGAIAGRTASACARPAKPGGTLVYATCSLECEQGEDQAGAVSLTTDPITRDGLPQGVEPGSAGWLRTDPGMLEEHGGLDGFFIARWRRDL